MTRRPSSRNGVVAGTAALVIVVMLGLTAASVPLYNLFCKATGYDGTPRIAAGEARPAAGANAAASHEVTVFFNADTGSTLPWSFHAAQRQVTVKVGEDNLAFFEAANRSDRPIVGHAVYNVTPDKAAYYFVKLECFCFQNQTLEPGQKVQMPVSFYVDPAMLEDPNAREVQQITLSYTFYLDADATAELDRKRQQAATLHGPAATAGRSG
ncbi:MAG TPA: cytochrome c oxidase assembly protein [Gaiellales bacterium]|nr:cytochrome c oxidase assembly protein [Gaiellales bacterium]